MTTEEIQNKYGLIYYSQKGSRGMGKVKLRYFTEAKERKRKKGYYWVTLVDGKVIEATRGDIRRMPGNSKEV